MIKRGLLVLLISFAVFAQDAAKSDTYLLQPGDVLDIKFFYNPELNQQVVVRPDGHINLQLVDDIQAAGLGTGELTQKLKERYDKDLARPELSVVVRSFSSQKAFVDGEVARPGVIDLVNQMTVMQSIAEAGGLRDTARASEVLLIRRSPDGPTVTRINLSKVFSAKQLSEDIALRPFDVVYVPRSRISKVNTWIDQYLRKNVPITFGFYTPVF